MTGKRHARKAIGLVAIASAAVLALSACAGGGATSGPAALSDEPVTLRFTWWGNDVRTANTEAVIAAFEAEHPNITIEPQYADWNGYWDKLATETAANDSPDIIQMDEKYISTYGGRGALLDLNDTGDLLDLSDFSKSSLDLGTAEGALYGIPVGLTTYAVMVNPTVLESAGVTLPDDKSWTWDDLEKAGAAVSAAGAGNVFGVQSWGFEEGGLNNWARQHDDALYNDAGDVVIKADTLTSWWEYMLELSESGVSPAASATTERQNAGLAESFLATNSAGFATGWASQLTALQDASGSPLELLQIPTSADAASDSAYFKPSMYWSVSARTAHPAEAAVFLDYLVNSEEAATLLGTDRGVPANDAIRSYLEPTLPESGKSVVAFLDSLTDVVGEAPPLTPAGGSAIEAIVKRYTEQVLFKQATPAEAAQGFIRDLKAAIAAG
ncbi:ABC transporter substrate-binding protein [Cryobacterium sp. Y57]|uniref:ABC transporter substrate-binding protein n=1 Tax=Cryobacterium sp. Y57 TaxID=2048287 RepID=UPI000CE343ED|nr:extracellular solute-binding protein [Cryobacterium sp. Y57]